MISKKALITDRQWLAMKAYGIELDHSSTSKKVASSFLRYILSGNDTIGKTAAERVAITKSYIGKYIGKEVIGKDDSTFPGRQGVIVRLVARTTSGVKLVKNHEWMDKDAFVHPFVATIRWSATDGQSAQTSSQFALSLFRLAKQESADE